jgi:hypothetical protein
MVTDIIPINYEVTVNGVTTNIPNVDGSLKDMDMIEFAHNTAKILNTTVLVERAAIVIANVYYYEYNNK